LASIVIYSIEASLIEGTVRVAALEPNLSET
jgi:hypothetical protein